MTCYDLAWESFQSDNANIYVTTSTTTTTTTRLYFTLQEVGHEILEAKIGAVVIIVGVGGGSGGSNESHMEIL